MGDVVNLRQARKKLKRREREREADENRARHGRTRAEKQAGALDRKRAEALHEAHRRERPGDEKA